MIIKGINKPEDIGVPSRWVSGITEVEWVEKQLTQHFGIGFKIDDVDEVDNDVDVAELIQYKDDELSEEYQNYAPEELIEEVFGSNVVLYTTTEGKIEVRVLI